MYEYMRETCAHLEEVVENLKQLELKTPLGVESVTAT